MLEFAGNVLGLIGSLHRRKKKVWKPYSAPRVSYWTKVTGVCITVTNQAFFVCWDKHDIFQGPYETYLWTASLNIH